MNVGAERGTPKACQLTFDAPAFWCCVALYQLDAGCLVSWDQELKQEELGIAKVCVPALVDGNTKEDSGCAAFMPPAPLLHPVTGASKATRAPGTSCQLCVQADVSGLLTCGWLMGIV